MFSPKPQVDKKKVIFFHKTINKSYILKKTCSISQNGGFDSNMDVQKRFYLRAKS